MSRRDVDTPPALGVFRLRMRMFHQGEAFIERGIHEANFPAAPIGIASREHLADMVLRDAYYSGLSPIFRCSSCGGVNPRSGRPVCLCRKGGSDATGKESTRTARRPRRRSDVRGSPQRPILRRSCSAPHARYEPWRSDVPSLPPPSVLSDQNPSSLSVFSRAVSSAFSVRNRRPPRRWRQEKMPASHRRRRSGAPCKTTCPSCYPLIAGECAVCGGAYL
jgi:hypothetical protein